MGYDTHPPRLAPDAVFATRNFLNRLRPIPVFKLDYFQDMRDSNPECPNDWCEIDIKLVGIEGDCDLLWFRKSAADWEGTLAAIADDLTTRLREAMDWLREFGRATQHSDITYIAYPSISEHGQSGHTSTWTQLIALTRDGYDALVSTGNNDAAARLARRWLSLPYPVFRRLALYAATRGYHANDVEFGLQILLDGSHRALWDFRVQCETLRFLRKRGRDIRGQQLIRLTKAILKGPPRNLYAWNKLRDKETLLRLHELKESGTPLPVRAQEVYDRIQGDQPCQPSGDHLENFAEMSVEQFIEWSDTQTGEPWECDRRWHRFVAKDIQAAVKLLKGASENKIRPISPWYAVLATRQKENGTNTPKNEIASLLIDMPSKTLAILAFQAAGWLEDARPRLGNARRQKLWRRIWDASVKGETPEGDLDSDLSLNHAGGILGRVLYDELLECVPNFTAKPNVGFPRQLRPDFEFLAENDRPSAKLARVRIAPRLSILYRIDPNWTVRAFFRRMDPDKESFDPYLWEGYFWFAHCSVDLLEAFKPLLLKILQNRDRIPEHVRDNAVISFIYLAVPPGRSIDTDEAKKVLWKVGADGLADAARALRNILEGAGDKSHSLWRDTVGPWFEQVWPKRPVDRSAGLSINLAQMAMDSGDAFPDVVNAIKDILTAENYSTVLVHLKTKEKETGLVRRCPEAALTLVDKLFDAEGHGNRRLLRELLNAISMANPGLKGSDSFKRLDAKAD